MKRMFIKPLVTALASAGLGLASLSASAVEYSLFDLGSLGGSYARTFATGINNSGQVVGYGYQFDPSQNGTSATDDYQAFVTGANGQGLTGLGMFAGDQWSKAAAINDAGQVVGTSTNASGTQSAFITSLANPSLRKLDTVGSSTANAINASGQVVGTAGAQAYITAANGGAVSVLDASSFGTVQRIAANGVNAAGQVVGNYSEFPYSALGKGYVTGPNGSPVNALPGRNVAPGNDAWTPQLNVAAINAEGQTVGSYLEYGGSAFLKNPDGTDLVLDVTSAPHYVPGNMGGSGQYGPNSSSLAYGLNARGQVVGSIVRNGLSRASYAFITGEDGSGLVEVNSLSFVNHSGPFDFNFTSAMGINDAGDFIVNGSNGHAYLVSVVPEPESIALLLAGLGVVGIAGRRQRRNAQSASPHVTETA